jgi:antirestriction protein ArdC
MGSAFLCAEAGIDNTLENSAAYIASWRRKLQDPNNKKWVVEAGSKAKRAVEYIKGDIRKK